MKATGIVRRIDDLGRVVIPKELRRNLNIREGDPLELFTTNDGMVCLKKYMPTTEREWAKARDMINALYPKLSFALYNAEGQKMAFSGILDLGATFDITRSDVDDYAIMSNNNCKDTLGYLLIHPKCERDITFADEEKLRNMVDILLTERE